MSKVKGYKSMDSKMQCRDFQFEVGKTYETDEIKMCERGFHFCEILLDVYNYYPKSADTIVCEVEACGDVQKKDDKSVTNRIKIIRRLNEKELLQAWMDKNNTGNHNTGHYNTGYYNTGYHNTGYYNTGYHNTGNHNTGHYNTGNHNTGHHNTGYYNTGDRNTGYYNTGHYNTGYFNTETAKVKLFNKECDLPWNDPRLVRIKSLNVKPILKWADESEMTEKEKTENPNYKIKGGYLKNTGKFDWSQLTADDKALIQSLPGFDAEVFKSISGIDLDTVEVTVNGQVKTISKSKAKELGLID